MPAAEAEITAGLADRLAAFTEEDFAVISAAAADASSAATEACRVLTGRGFRGVYVSLAKDYLGVSASLGAGGVDLSRMSFVDAISRMYGIAPVESPEVTYVDGPLSTDALIEGIGASLERHREGKSFVIIDSLTVLLMYNTADAAVGFTESLRGLLKSEHAAGIILVSHLGTPDKDLLLRLMGAGGEVIDA